MKQNKVEKKFLSENQAFTSVLFVFGTGFHVTTAPRKFPKTCRRCSKVASNRAANSFATIMEILQHHKEEKEEI